MITVSAQCENANAARKFLDGERWHQLVEEYDEWLRAELKYKDAPAKLDEARTKLYELMGEHGLELYGE